jgi:bacterioferritin
MQCDLRVELACTGHLKEAIAHCEGGARLREPRAVREGILDDTEEHIDHLETQLGLVDKVGEANYLQSQMSQTAS